MADPTGIVNDCVGRHVGYVESSLGRQVGYVIHYKRNLEDLRTQVGELNVDKDTMREKVRAAEDKGEMIHKNVQDWLEKVDEITEKANDLLKDKRQSTTEEANNPLKDEGQPKTKCVQGFCPNPILRRRRSKESLEFKDEVIELINKGRQLSNISYAPPKNLRIEVDKLRVAKDTVDAKVSAAEANGEKIFKNVLDWLEKVDEITKKAQELWKDEIQATQEPNDSSSHRSKKLLEMLRVVTELYEKREFPDISYVVQAKDVCLESGQDYQEFDSRATTVEKIMDELRSPNCADIILVHGIGGVGKTTLAEQVLRQAEKEKLFDDSVMVRDVKKPNLEEIQKVIADKLGLDVLKFQTTDGRADKICDRIKGKKKGESKQDKKTLVIIDDVWEEIDFKALGLPVISTCRILLTSRLFYDRINQKSFQLGVLGEKETWLLFKKTTGNVVEDLSIQPIATQVAQKCRGLPVLVVAVSSRLRNETCFSVWRDALRSLKEFDKEEELTERAYLGLEWSYTQLKEHLKPLFLLCGTIVEGNSISLTNLLKYSMGLGFFKKTYTVQEARDALDTQVGKLKASSLLLDGDDDTCVRMHDLVHHVVNQIASRDHHVLVQDGADGELKEWTGEDLFRCSKISLPCCNIATLPGVPWECPKLEMFHLHNKNEDDDLEMFHWHNDDDDDDDDEDEDDDMPSNFFKEMKNLKVLGLNNLPPISLPSTLQCLTNLQTLCLDGCKFKDIAQVGELTSLQILSIVKSTVKQLPKEIGQLSRLRLLDLSECSRLKVISPGVISNLTSLEELRMRNSFDKWEGEGVICETSNARLLELKNLSKLTALEIRIADANILPPNLFSDKLERYQISVGYQGHRHHRIYETTLNTLELRFTSRNELDQGLKMLLKKCDVLCLKGWGDCPKVRFPRLETIWHGQLAPGSFDRLREVYVDNCHGLRSFFPASMATCLQQLQKLEVDSCDAMETIVGKEEGRLESTTPHPKFVFPKVKSLTFSRMSTLSSFYPQLHASKWPLLENMTFKFCHKVELLAAELSIVQERQHARPFFLINQEVMFNYLTTLTVSYCNGLKCLFSSSVARNFKKLKYLEILYCENMEQIISTREQDEEHNMFGELKSLRLEELPNLARFCTGKSSEFPLLEELYIKECIKLGAFVGGPMTKSSRKEETRERESEENFLFDEKEVMFNYLTTLRVHGCYGLKCLFSSSVAQNFKKLKHLEVSDCIRMEQIISTTKQDEEHNMFGELKSLGLEELPNLARFCTGKSIEFPLLEELYIKECIKLGAFVGGPMTKSSRKEETRERESEENFLFDEKVRFPILEIFHLTPGNLGNIWPQESELQTIWHDQLAPGSFGRLREVQIRRCDSLKVIFPPGMMGRLNALETLDISSCQSVEVVFDERGETNVNETHGTSTTQLKDGQNLISVQIGDCDSLKNIFPASMATGCLQQLQELNVSICGEMESIVAKEEGGLELTTPHPKFVFPKVKSLSFDYLSTLTSFYPGLHTSKWPSLKHLNVEGCNKVEFLAAEVSIFQERHPHAPTKQPLFLIDQDSFPVLEQMIVGTTEILYGQSPAESIFSRLKSIRFNRCAPFSKHAALHTLESLEVYACPSEEIFVDEGNSSGEIHAVGSLPMVRNLKLSSMNNLMHLGKEKYSQPVFTNLEFLRVEFCHRLKNLESSAISFQNLTALEVLRCDGLEYVIPYSAAKCLVHLTKMKVTNCQSITVIVASNGDDDAGKNEIVFSQLQHLKLAFLPNLQGFSSGNCIAKLPLSLNPDVTYCPIKLKISPDGVPIPETANNRGR